MCQLATVWGCFQVSTDKAYLTRQAGGRDGAKPARGMGPGAPWEEASDMLADQLAGAQPLSWNQLGGVSAS